MDDVVIPRAFGVTRMAHNQSLNSTLINLFIKHGLNDLLPPPPLSIAIVPSALCAYVWQILALERLTSVFA